MRLSLIVWQAHFILMEMTKCESQDGVGKGPNGPFIYVEY